MTIKTQNDKPSEVTMKKLLSVFTFFLFLALPVLSYSAEASKDPIFRIESGMHSAMIWRIGIDAGNRWLVTGSDDKTVRVWDLSFRSREGQREARLVRTLRPPIGAGNEGKIFSVAIAPDGGTIACGGWTQFNNGMNDTAPDGHTIYLFDRESGRLAKKINGLPSVITHLAYSKDGRFLAASLASNGIRVYRTSDYALFGQDTDYGSYSLGADFDENNRLATTSKDGYVRLYSVGSNRDVPLQLIAKEKAPGGSLPYSVMFSPDGTKIALGFQDSTGVNVLSGRGLSYLYSPDTSDLNSGDMTVSWSSDGKQLFAGGKASKQFGGEWKRFIRKWSDQGRGPAAYLTAADQTIMQILPLKDGGIVYGATDPSFGIFQTDGTRIMYKSSSIADYRNNQELFLVSNDGTKVKFGYEVWGKSPAVFDLRNRMLLSENSEDSNLSKPITSMQGLFVTDWKDTTNPKLNGAALKLQQYETSRSLAISPDGESFLLGADWYLRLFDRSGNVKWNVPVPGTAWDVNISGDNKMAVAAFGDGTIRWYRMTDGKEVMAFFPHNDKKRWVLWSPSGYYDASTGADELIGWHLNNGKDREADFFPASKFRSTYYRPDVLANVLSTLDESEAIRLANEEAGKKVQTASIHQMLPPVVSIVSPKDSSTVSAPEVTVRFTVRTPSGEPVTGTKAFVDGRPASSQRGVQIKPKGDATQEIRVAVPAQDSEISIIAENRYSASEPATIRIKWAGKVQKGEFVIKPKLYVLAVGVSKYRDKELTLGLAAKDARDFGAAAARLKGGLYRDVTVKVLANEQATKDDILDGLDWLQKETTSKDVAMVFFAGHGVNDQSGVYYYLPVNADTEKLKRTGVVFSDIKNTLDSLAGKTVLFMDTCHSGNVMGTRRGVADITAVVNELASAESGVVVFASSTGKQYSLEDQAWGNGAFTKALVEGLNGKADMTGSGRITINMLDLYLSERVKELTKGKQTPTTTKPQTVPDFPVAIRK
jgi:WD40 repeat protein